MPNFSGFFNPPHLPKNKTPLGLIQDNKSIIVAAFALPIPKLIMLRPSLFIAEVIGPPNPLIFVVNLLANFST